MKEKFRRRTTENDMKSVDPKYTFVVFAKTHCVFFLFICFHFAVKATTYNTISPGSWTDGATWQGGSVPPLNLNGGDIVNINHRVFQTSGTLKMNKATLNVNNVLLITSGSLEMEHATDEININSGVIIVLNGIFLNKKGLVTINGGGVQMCNSGYKDESTGNSKGTVGIGYIYTDNGNIDNVGNAPFSSNIAWCSENGGQSGMPTSENCVAVDPPSCDDETYHLSYSLPVELIGFSAEKINNDILLKWSTASETNNEKFILEYSENGNDFSYLSESAGQGSTNEKSDYSFVHHNAHLLFSNIIYYRLKQIDFSGKHEYSKIISIRIEKNKDGSIIFPNPIKSGRILTLQNKLINHIEIIDPQNRLIFEQESNNENSTEIPTENLTPGIYFIRINDQEVQKIIIL